MLIDSNILIYAAQPAHAHLRQLIAVHAPAVSAVSYVEVLGYHQLDDEARQYLEAFFRLARVLPLSRAVLEQAVALRQRRKMSLGDALVAGTALAHGLTLVTRNVEDFELRIWPMQGGGSLAFGLVAVAGLHVQGMPQPEGNPLLATGSPA